ncbi:TIGR00730 family Rossman fold protein [uncultured Maricaulis sp.]|uniref:LOG family protein n=1 Tax=uncultured Maricaulis sp. TaxID=174710 RepID=UPI0026194D1B|nr:TIGR00730 family Rossman fold protein [uncultured Maricaulis sp.]
MKSICVYCGSNAGQDPAFLEVADRLGQIMALRGIELVYGGGRVGLMGRIADATLAAGGRVVGVIPEFLALKEIAHMELTTLHVVKSMHARKAKMEQLSEGFIAMPGGIGTMEEMFEIWTWAQLGQHRHPVGLLNVNGYYDELVAFLDKMTEQGFLAPEHRGALIVADRPTKLLDAFEAYKPPPADVRIKTGQT